jgi:hypothetical protein
MHLIFANIIWILHILFVLFFTGVPFLDIKRFPELHILHLMTGPLLWVHWLANSDECALTRIEMFLRGDTEKGESFFYNLVAPIYAQSDDTAIRQTIWFVSIVLWLITLTKFIKNPCVFKTFMHKLRNGGRTAADETAGVTTLKEVVIIKEAGGRMPMGSPPPPVAVPALLGQARQERLYP